MRIRYINAAPVRALRDKYATKRFFASIKSFVFTKMGGLCNAILRKCGFAIITQNIFK